MLYILITGINSYIGRSVFNYLMHWSDKYNCTLISLRDNNLNNINFSKYSIIFHVAGMAHADIAHVDNKTKELYYTINTKLAIDTAEKAKQAGCRQFIYMSSSIVYGNSAPIGIDKFITKNTLPHPENFYGDSKLKAEEGILQLSEDTFKICILRAPMIYGKGSKGNYPVLSRLAKKLVLFPDIDNNRSMLFIGNLCAFVKNLIDNNRGGIYWPQNREYVKTSKLVSTIAGISGKKIKLIKGLTPFFKLICHIPGCIGNVVNKVYGNLCYDQSLSFLEGYTPPYSFEESIKETEL
jgi:UDP-glucose 4-epimerase